MTTAAEKVAGTCYLLEEILIRLPAKSLARSKLVSKQWLSQISNPQFLQLHSRHRPNKLPTGMFLTDSESICSDANFVSFSDLNPIHQTIPSLGFLYDGIKHLVVVGVGISEIKLLKSCNGLLLCLVTFNSKPWDFRHSSRPKYCVCNPTTKKFRLLPPAPFSLSSILKNYLAFDPSLSLHYKVICTQSFGQSENPYEIYIYSSENQCWSTYASPFDPRREWFYLNGSMYCTENSLRFDVYAEKMEQITMRPRKMGGNYTKKSLPVIGNHVYCVIRTRKDHGKVNLQVLEMSSDFSEWIPKYDINFSPLLSKFPKIAVLLSGPGFKEVWYRFEAICVVDGVKEDETELVLGIPGKLISYNLKEKTAKELCALHGELSDIDGYRRALVYHFIECLSDV